MSDQLASENEGDLGPKGGGEERKRKKEKEKDCILEIPFNSRFRLIPEDMSVGQTQHRWQHILNCSYHNHSS